MSHARCFAFGSALPLRLLGATAFGLVACPAVGRPPAVSRRLAFTACSSGVDDVFTVSPYAAQRLQRERGMSLGQKSPSATRASSTSPDPGLEDSRLPSAAEGANAEAGSSVEDAAQLDSVSTDGSGTSMKYATHSDFVESVLRLTGDPLEDDARVVLHRGSPSAKLMIIGEAPGQNEDREGVPFVGRAGQLLDDIFTYAGFDMDKHVYITNVVKRRPPENRTPTDDEIDFYLPLLMEEIRLVDPAIIILAGAVPLKAILDMKGITKARGKVVHVEISGRSREVMPVFHPAYLLRVPRLKHEMKVDIDEIRKMYMDKFPEETLAEPRRTKPRRNG